MRQMQSANKRMKSRNHWFGCFSLIGLALFLFLGFSSVSRAMLPFYAQDYEGQLFDQNGQTFFPIETGIIEDFALLYTEGGNRPGDASYFNSPEKMFYFGTTIVWYGGLPGDFPNGREVLFHERNFYHSTDPSSLIAWWDGSSVEIRWDWDSRFSRRNGCNEPFVVDEAQRYRLWRFDSPVDSTLVSDDIWGVNSYSDTPPDPEGAFSYRVETWATEGNDLGTFLEFTPYGEAVVASRESGPHFFHNRSQVQESFYHEASCGNLGENEPLVYSVQFGVEGAYQLGDLELQVCTDYDPDPANSVGPVFLDVEEFEFSMVDGEPAVQVDIETTLVGIRDTGGFAYRLKFLSDTGEERFLPPEKDGRIRFFWSSINNRIMECNWFDYFTKINGLAWRENSLIALNALHDGISFNGRPTQSFDSVFMDSALGRLSSGPNATHNRVRPYEYSSQQQYFADTVSHLDYLSQSSQIDMYINTTNSQLIDAVSSLGKIKGFMAENPTRQESLTVELIQAIWSIHVFPQKRSLILEQGDHLGLPGEEGGVGTRKQVLATYLLSMANLSSSEAGGALLGYGNWKVPEHVGKPIIMPEQMLNVVAGDDIVPPTSGWASGLEIDNINDSMGETWLAANLPGLISESNGRSFAWRRNELQDSSGNTIGNVWAVIDVEPNSAQSSGTYSLGDVIDQAGNRTEYFRLELENDKVLLAEGGSFTTSSVGTNESIYTEPGSVSIYFDVPIHTPEIASMAVNPLPFGPGTNPVLEIEANTWNGVPLESFIVDGSSLGWGSDIQLDGPNGDSVYSYAGPAISGDSRIVDLPYEAIGSDGLRRYGIVEVKVGAYPVFSNKSADTGDLYDIGDLPWAATTLNAGDDLNNPGVGGFGNEDLFVSVQGSSDVAALFEQYQMENDTPQFLKADNLFPLGQEPHTDHRGIAVADFDNDGFEDLLVSHAAPGKTRLYRWSPEDGYFEDALVSGYAVFEGGFPASNYSAAWGDYNQDGYLDLFLAQYPHDLDEDLLQLHNPATATARSWIYEARPRDGGITFFPVEFLPGVLANNASLSLNWVDIDGDTDIDIVFTTFFGGGVNVLINSGYPDYSYSDETETWMQAPVYSIFSSTLADLDNDGQPDLITTSTLNSCLFRVFKNMGPTQGFVPMATQDELGILDWTTVSTGDLDLNGFVDIVAAPYYGYDHPYLLLNGLSGEGFDFNHHPGAESMRTGGRPALVVHDWGNDGDPDLYLPHHPDEFGTDKDFLFLNGQGENNSAPLQNKVVRVCVVGSHTGGVCAKVAIQASPGGPVRTAYARISEGRGGQTSRIVVFGVPDDSDGVVSGTVTWPNGEETIHSFNVGSSMNFVSQAMPSPLANGSVSASRNVGPTSAELEFECTAAKPLIDFQVELDLAGDACACGGGQGSLVLNESYPGVVVEVSRIGESSFRHTLTLTDWCCVNNCIYSYTMRGKYGTETWDSGTQTLTTSTCGKKLPWDPHQD